MLTNKIVRKPYHFEKSEDDVEGDARTVHVSCFRYLAPARKVRESIKNAANPNGCVADLAFGTYVAK
jgi:hypothetical protein